jgi:DHA2 family multidrug resistance protein
MTFNDIFWIMGMGTLVVLPLVFFLRPLPKGAAPAAMH